MVGASDQPPASDATEVLDRAAVAAAGHRGDELTARRGLVHAQPAVRATALGALRRCAALEVADLCPALSDPSPTVRRRAAELCGTPRRAPLDGGPAVPRTDESPDSADLAEPDGSDRSAGSAWMTDAQLTDALVGALSDPDVYVVDAAAWALGERESPGEHDGPGDPAASDGTNGVVAALAAVVTDHDDALAREAAVAALGAIGDEAGLAAIVAATSDKPAVRRRAVLALAPFDGPEVEAALQRALGDRDWQVRQAAEDLMGAAPTASEHDLTDDEGTRPDW